jgi:ABC-type uncharacterized transport system permease subunit
MQKLLILAALIVGIVIGAVVGPYTATARAMAQTDECIETLDLYHVQLFGYSLK